ncbi:Uncharacterised protein [Aggregatibacter aphrophilus]|uniref:Uncharacterized protein n=1 Tax=Aggregatibacter aphrophilus TaxID=732 RepID=A0A336N7Z9_AGGAP|nr:Uncharacterised protein [Aggregatibacter aphrophilus]
MKKCLKILLVIVIVTIIGLFWLYRYFECNPLHLGGGPSDPPPARCYAKEQEQQRKTQMAQLEQLAALEFTCKKKNFRHSQKRLNNYITTHFTMTYIICGREIREMMYGTD